LMRFYSESGSSCSEEFLFSYYMVGFCILTSCAFLSLAYSVIVWTQSSGTERSKAVLCAWCLLTSLLTILSVVMCIWSWATLAYARDVVGCSTFYYTLWVFAGSETFYIVLSFFLCYYLPPS
jgi:sterol desaturase/sphingolipid hydroxylase (fatty acid hydroxylase superfamily)